MTGSPRQTPYVVIACGGTGGHLFPGCAVADRLVAHGATVTLVVSSKAVDGQALRSMPPVDVATLPAVALQTGSRLGFFLGLLRSYRLSLGWFRRRRPSVVLAMGGFTSAGPVLAARTLGVPVCLHESNSVPGRANRWLSRLATQVFIGFSSAATRLRAREVHVTGTPVRERLRPACAATCRRELGLDPDDPVVLVMGGSQGASAINRLVTDSLPELRNSLPRLQWLHLTGARDEATVRTAYAGTEFRHQVHAFFEDMEVALGAATCAVSRAGASALAELAAMQVPALLIPYPHAVDQHQLRNAKLFETSGAALVLEEATATPDDFVNALIQLTEPGDRIEKMREVLAGWHRPRAAEVISERLLRCANYHHQPDPELESATPELRRSPSIVA